MTRFTINGADLTGLRDKVVLLTGGSSGIGLATARLLLDLGAKVVMGDLHHPPDDLSSQNLTYMPLDVTNWKQLCAVFKKTVEVHGRIDHVFANAGEFFRLFQGCHITLWTWWLDEKDRYFNCSLC
jgi:NAD(P)-dependent dehydrogenase (short-subunit alcohol dehydrogenase family)